jgi:hypothetical protein
MSTAVPSETYEFRQHSQATMLSFSYKNTACESRARAGHLTEICQLAAPSLRYAVIRCHLATSVAVIPFRFDTLSSGP